MGDSMNCYKTKDKIVLKGRAGKGRFTIKEKSLEQELTDSYYETKASSQEEAEALEDLYCKFFI